MEMKRYGKCSWRVVEMVSSKAHTSIRSVEVTEI